MIPKRLGLFTRTYAHFNRYRQILFVLLKYGFGDLLHTLGVDQYLEFRWAGFKAKSKMTHLSRAARMRMALEELGPTFVKMGQMLSTRSDLLPRDILEELTKLQDHVPPFPVEQAKQVIEADLGCSCAESFLVFDETPLAAGSIGQVHRATLHSGENVVVKIRRPGIRKKIEVDLEIMADMAALLERAMEVAQVHRPTQIVEEFAHTIRLELDYRFELANIQHFTAAYGQLDKLFIPSVFPDFSTARVLTISFVAGIKPSQASTLKEAGLDPPGLARIGVEMIMRQVFEEGFFHADPHPGNMLVLTDGRLCLLDFGMMGRLDRQSRELFAELMMAIIARDEEDVAELMLKLTHSHKLVDRPGLEREIGELIDHYLYRPLKDLEIGVLVRSLLALTARYGLRIPPQFFLLMKAVSQLEDLGHKLDPNFNMPDILAPHLRRILIHRYHPKRMLREFWASSSEMVYLLREVPGEVRELLKQAKQGKVRIEFEYVGLRSLVATINRLSSHLASAIVLASLIIGSSLIVLSKVPPLWNEIPIIGLIGYILSFLMGLLLLRAISRGKRG